MKPLLIALVGCVLLAPAFGVAENPKDDAVVEKQAAPAKSDEAKVVVKEAAAAEQKAALAQEAAPAPAAAEAAVDEAQAFEQQFAPQFKQLLKAELHFVRMVCQPTKDQNKQITAAGETSMKQAKKKFGEVQKQMQRGWQAGQQPTFPDPAQLITEGLAKSVKETLSAEQAASYQAELDKRAASRKRVALLVLVSKLDNDLVLTSDQRLKLSESLASNWKEAWGRMEILMYGDNYFPTLPENLVAPILNARQKEVWKGIPKNDNVFWGFAGFGILGGVEIDEVVEVEQPAQKANADDKKDASE